MNRPMMISLIFVIALFGVSCQSAESSKADDGARLRVMTFNLWVGGDAVKLQRDTAIKYQLEAIRLANADVVGFQEQTTSPKDKQSRAKLLADRLGWHCHIIDGSRAVISKYQLRPLDTTKISQAVLLKLPGGDEVVLGVMHLMYTPYEPYDIADRKLLNAEAAEASARKTRLYQVRNMLEEIAAHSDYPTILMGDYNEPSCLDWTEVAIRERGDTLLPFAVNWPATALLIEKGFKDAYREMYPDVKDRPGYTWTSMEGHGREPEIHDRIDLIYVSEDCFTAREAQVVGESSSFSDIVVEPWTSDHRAVVMGLVIR